MVDGVVKDLLNYFREDMKEVMELPALKNCLVDRSAKARQRTAASNRQRLELVHDSLALTNGTPQGAIALSRRGTGSKSASKLPRSKSNLTWTSDDQAQGH